MISLTASKSVMHPKTRNDQYAEAFVKQLKPSFNPDAPRPAELVSSQTLPTVLKDPPPIVRGEPQPQQRYEPEVPFGADMPKIVAPVEDAGAHGAGIRPAPNIGAADW